MANSIVNAFNELFQKPKDISIFEYIPIVLKKDERYGYIGILLICIAIFYLLTK